MHKHIIRESPYFRASIHNNFFLVSPRDTRENPQLRSIYKKTYYMYKYIYNYSSRAIVRDISARESHRRREKLLMTMFGVVVVVVVVGLRFSRSLRPALAIVLRSRAARVYKCGYSVGYVLGTTLQQKAKCFP